MTDTHDVTAKEQPAPPTWLPQFKKRPAGGAEVPRPRGQNGAAIKIAMPERLSYQDFLWETSQWERTHLGEQLAHAIVHFLSESQPVYLDNFGLLRPNQLTHEATHVLADELVLRRETVRTCFFEKCDDPLFLPLPNGKKAVAAKELTEALYPRLPLSMHLQWTKADALRFVRGFIQLLKHETIAVSYSSLLQPVGCFYALHNRQGSTPAEWFAGADIVFTSSYRQLLQTEHCRAFKRPVLNNSWELLQAALGPPIQELSLDIRRQLKELDCEIDGNADVAAADYTVKVQVFHKQNAGRRENFLVYCTDGLRKQPLALGRSGVEFIFQVAADNDNGHCITAPPEWPLRALTGAWILLQSTTAERLQPGLGVSLGEPLDPGCTGQLDTVMLNKCAWLSQEYLSPQGPFHYLNVLGITALEAERLRRFGSDYLDSLLRHKRLDQVTRPARSCLFGRNCAVGL